MNCLPVFITWTSKPVRNKSLSELWNNFEMLFCKWKERGFGPFFYVYNLLWLSAWIYNERLACMPSDNALFPVFFFCLPKSKRHPVFHFWPNYAKGLISLPQSIKVPRLYDHLSPNDCFKVFFIYLTKTKQELFRRLRHLVTGDILKLLPVIIIELTVRVLNHYAKALSNLFQ